MIGRIADTEEGRRAAPLLRSGRLSGLSFGYRVREAKQEDGARELFDLDLVEVSLVARPMQPKARVHAVETNA